MDVRDIAHVARDLRARAGVRDAEAALERARGKLEGRTRACAERGPEAADIGEAKAEVALAEARLEEANAMASKRKHWLTEIIRTGGVERVRAVDGSAPDDDDGSEPR